MEEDPYSEFPESNSSEKPKINKVIYVLIGLVLLIVFVSVLFFIPTRDSVCSNGICEVDENCFDCPDDCKCGKDKICSEEKKLCVEVEEKEEKYSNGVCDSEENCWDHQKDCKCGEDEYCSKEKKQCLKSICGDGVCDPLENPITCCDDCPCFSEGEICNKETHMCEFPINLTDERAEELAIKYFEDKGKEVSSAEFIYTGLTEDEKIAKFINVVIKGEELFLHVVSVTEDEEIKEEEVY